MTSSLAFFSLLHLGILFHQMDGVSEASMSPMESREFCHFTRFEVTCSADEILVFSGANYGRMRIGSCVRTNFGFVGCFVDVLDVLDQRCSGRRTCSFDVVEPTFENRRPCNDELKNYLEVDFTCITVASVPSGSCDVSLRGETSSLPIGRHDTRKCGTTSSPWKILAPRFGQRLNVTLVHLSNNASHKEVQTTTTMTSAGCQSYVTVREPLRHSSRDVCIRRSVREYSIYLSESETIELETNDGGGGGGSGGGGYLVIISVTGCPDFPPPHGAWIRYSSDRRRANVGCQDNHLDVTWNLVCTGNTWTGHHGNCTGLPDSFSVTSASGKFDTLRLNTATMIVLWLVVSSSISLSVLLLGLLIHRRVRRRRRTQKTWRRSRRRSAADQEQEEEEEDQEPEEEEEDGEEEGHVAAAAAAAAKTSVCLTSKTTATDDRRETEAAGGGGGGGCGRRSSSTSGHLYDAFVHRRGLLTSVVGFHHPPKQRPAAAAATTCLRHCVCKTCGAGCLCSRQVDRLIFIPKEDSDDCFCAIKTNETAKSLLMATVSSQSKDDSYC